VTAVLRVERLRVRLGGHQVLDVESLEAPGGAVTVLLGGAGSGKTVLAAALAGSIPSAGVVGVNGRQLEGPPSQRRRAGLAAAVRDGERVTGCTVLEALLLAAGGSPRAGQALERFPQLGGRRSLDAGFLSGGEQQMLQVAAAWAALPSVLVLDSPTVGLAADAAEAVSRLALDEAERGAAVLWLEQDRRAAPVTPGGELVRGTLRAAAAESAPGVE
jgi:branched-chain amino acid transport system ATP-binding protein